jgi:carbamoyl-phosphate synthase large subunit
LNRRTCVAITGVGGAAGITVIKGLKTAKTNARVIGFDSDRLSAGFKYVNRAYCVPKATNKDFVRVLLQKCLHEKVELLIPTVDEELLELAHQRNLFTRANIKIALSSTETINTAGDKWLVFKRLTRAGVPTPRTWLPSTYDYSVFPVLVKPRRGRGGREIYVCKDKQEAAFAVKKVAKPIVQEFLAAKEYTVDTFSDVNGVPQIAVPRRALMRKYGLMWRGTTEHNTLLEDTCKEAAENLKIVGPGCFQGFYHQRKFKIFEAHCRIGGTTSLSVAAGVNIPFMTLQLFLYGHTEVPTAFKRISISRYTEEVFY